MKTLRLTLAFVLLTSPAGAQSSSLYTNSTSVGIGTAAPTAGAALDLSYKTNSMLLPIGTTGQRPTGVDGMLRYNSTTPGVEVYYGGVWNELGSLTTPALPNGTTATTQSANDSSTKVATTAFANPSSSLGSSGYIQLPSGLIEQWGNGTTSLTVPVTVTFPIAFTNNVFQILVSASCVTSTPAFVTSSTVTTSGFDVSGWATSGARAATCYSYFSIGD